jgi:uncharacterized membrane protein YccC
MRHTLLIVLAVLLSAGAIVYALLVVAGNLRQVSDDLEVVTRDIAGMSDDVRSLADDVNAIADALAGEDDDDETRQAPAAAVSDAPTAGRARRAPGTAARRHARVHRAAVHGSLASQGR